MRPFVIAPVAALRRRLRSGGVAFEPAVHVVVKILFAPEQSAERLAHDVLPVRRDGVGYDGSVEIVRFALARGEDTVEFTVERLTAGGYRVAEPQTQGCRLARCHRRVIVGGRFRSRFRRVHGVLCAMNDIVVDPVLDSGRAVLGAEKLLRVGFVFGEEKLRLALAVEPAIAVIVVMDFERGDLRGFIPADARLARIESPGPGVAKPQGR